MVDRATIFGSEAVQYDAVRPKYPADVIELIVRGTEIAVDAGCGTGIAASQVAAHGVRVIGVEPDAQMADVACSSGIDVTICRFEDWAPESADVVYAAQSWHWIDADRGAAVAARSIRPGGRWFAFWNHESDSSIDELLQPIYQRLVPGVAAERTDARAASSEFATGVAAGLARTGLFSTMTIDHVSWVDELVGRQFVDRLDSHSTHRLLDPDLRQRVREELLDALGGTTRLEVAYTTEVFSAQRCK